MYELRIAIKARKEFKRLSRAHQIIVLQVLQDIREDPFLGKKLERELTKRFSYRFGSYRVIYKVNPKDRIVLILTVGHRATVYN